MAHANVDGAESETRVGKKIPTFVSNVAYQRPRGHAQTAGRGTFVSNVAYQRSRGRAQTVGRGTFVSNVADRPTAQRVFSHRQAQLSCCVAVLVDIVESEVAQSELSELIEVFYNQKRRRSMLGYVSPVSPVEFGPHSDGACGMKISVYPLLALASLMLASRAGSSTPSPGPPDSGIESSAAWGEPERQGWLRDFRQLIGEMSSHYANLDWAVKERHMDLARLRSETEARILGARNGEEERLALRDFAAAFGDGHLKITWPDENKAPAVSQPPDGGSDGGSLCVRLGYTVRGRTGLDFSLLQGFRPLPDADQSGFPGVL